MMDVEGEDVGDDDYVLHTRILEFSVLLT